jgi:hypothetical protein
MTRMNIGHDGPASLLQGGDQAARGFPGIAAALRGPDHHPGDSAGPSSGPPAGSVAWTIPATAPVARTRGTQLPHSLVTMG